MREQNQKQSVTPAKAGVHVRNGKHISYFVYILTNQRNGILYVGVTNNIARRTWEHSEGTGSRFTERYGVRRLVYAETHDDIEQAIRRENAIKEWKRDGKIELFEGSNPEWNDLADTLTR